MSKLNKKIISADKLFARLFDDGVCTELLPLAESAEVSAACGKVLNQNVYAFAAVEGEYAGAMSTAQARKLSKLYAMAAKTGCPVIGFYQGSTAKVAEKNMLLDALGDLLASSSRLSGVVPQISVVLGDCVGTTAMLATSADFVVMTKDARLSLTTDCECTGQGKAAVVTEGYSEAINAVKELLDYIPANNLSASPVAEYADGDVFDADSEYELYTAGECAAAVSFARIAGKAVGVVRTKGSEIDKKAAKKIVSFVRFCDAFSIPVVTFVDAESFCCLDCANKVLSAYAEATTVKLSVVNGNATGAVYMALAGKAGRADVTIGMQGAVISPIKAQAAAYLALDGKLTGSVKEQDAKIAQYVATELCAENAAKAGYVDDVADAQTLRNKLINYLDALSGKREASLPKKHSTI